MIPSIHTIHQHLLFGLHLLVVLLHHILTFHISLHLVLVRSQMITSHYIIFNSHMLIYFQQSFNRNYRLERHLEEYIKAATHVSLSWHIAQQVTKLQVLFLLILNVYFVLCFLFLWLWIIPFQPKILPSYFLKSVYLFLFHLDL